MKVCKKCNFDLDDSEFSESKINKDGLRSICTYCDSIKITSKLGRVENTPVLSKLHKTLRQNSIVKYGLATIEALESLAPYWEE